MKIHFHITRQNKPIGIESEQRYLTWVGEIDWPSVPQEESHSWAHCGGWAIEKIHRVYFNGPQVTIGAEKILQHLAPITIEIKTSDEVMNHLVVKHDFVETRY